MIGEFIARLRDRASPPFALVEGAAELASVGGGAPNATPAAFVFTAEEAAGENERVTGVLQRMEVDVSVVIVTSNVSDAQGAAAAADIEALKMIVRGALVGWQPASTDDVVTNVGGKLVRAKEGLVWWELTFATALYLEG